MRPVVSLLTLIGVLASCDQPRQESASSCYAVGYLDITASAPLFVAQHLALFDSADVCVDPVQFNSSNQLVDAIAAGRLHYVVETSAVPVLALQLRSPNRVRITAASTISPEQPFDAILTRQADSLESLSHLEGRRIAVFPGTTATALLKEFLATEGVDTGLIEFIPTPPPNMLPALTSGAVDAVHAYEPTWTVGLADSALTQLHGTVYGQQLSPNPQGVSLISQAALTQDRARAERLIGAFDRALEIMRTDEEVTREALRRRFNLPGEAVETMHLLYMLPSAAIEMSSIRDYAELLVRVGELDAMPDLSSLILP